MKRIVIIGGGITGLAAAHRVLELCSASGRQVQLTLLEAGPRLGGIVQTHERDGFLLEQGPDSFISEKPAALKLAERLGLESQLIGTNERDRRSFIGRQGRLLPVPEGFHLLAPARLWPFVTSEIFSWSGKARMLMELALPRRKVNGSAAGYPDVSPDESLADFVRRRLGREALERMAQPMVGGIYTADPEKLSLQATMPRFLEMEHQHRSLIRALRAKQRRVDLGNDDKETMPSSRPTSDEGTSGARYSLFLSFDRGMQVLTDKLGQRISESASQTRDEVAPSIQVSTTVESLTRELSANDEPATWRIATNRQQTFAADAVCLALPATASARLLRHLDAQLATELEGISYSSSVTINLAYKRSDISHPLDGFGFVVPFIEKRSLLACTFSNVKFAGRAPEGFALLRAFVGGALQPELLELDDEQLLSRVQADLRDLLGVRNAPLFTTVARWRNSMPQYHLGHLDRVKKIQQRLSSLGGLTLAGNAYAGIGIPDCIRSGEESADYLVGL
ncbi:MAG TPA: protoporphyrinogen oxidase [Pyrinomonadaceae bacterium]|nr:protoporphyrinogen oxidase [Pyrinomonadaceae bacterium]